MVMYGDDRYRWWWMMVIIMMDDGWWKIQMMLDDDDDDGFWLMMMVDDGWWWMIGSLVVSFFGVLAHHGDSLAFLALPSFAFFHWPCNIYLAKNLLPIIKEVISILGKISLEKVSFPLIMKLFSSICSEIKFMIIKKCWTDHVPMFIVICVCDHVEATLMSKFTSCYI